MGRMHVVVTHAPDGVIYARLDGDIPAIGEGETEYEAVCRLASLLGDFVQGHQRTIVKMSGGTPPKSPATGAFRIIRGGKT